MGRILRRYHDCVDRKRVTFLMAFALCAATARAADDRCAAMLAEAEKTSPALTYQEFDQTEGKGWRWMVGQSCVAEAARLIDAYLIARDGLREVDKVNLSFHAGQTYALAGDYGEAIKRFRRAAVHPTAPPEFKWSEYVRATIAFLEHDADALVQNRDVIADAAAYGPNQSNLRVVDLLMKNFDRPYKDAIRAGGAERTRAVSRRGRRPGVARTSSAKRRDPPTHGVPSGSRN